MHVAERRVSVQEILTVKSEALVDAPKFHTGGVIPISSDGTEKPAIGGCFGKVRSCCQCSLLVLPALFNGRGFRVVRNWCSPGTLSGYLILYVSVVF